MWEVQVEKLFYENIQILRVPSYDKLRDINQALFCMQKCDKDAVTRGRARVLLRVHNLFL